MELKAKWKQHYFFLTIRYSELKGQNPGLFLLGMSVSCLFSLLSRNECKEPIALEVAAAMILVGGVKSCIMVIQAASPSWWRRSWSQKQGTG